MRNIFFLLIGLGFIACTKEQSLVVIENEFLSVQVSPIGAELQSIKSKGVEYLWQGDTTYWGGRSPIMFPVNVRFRENRYTFQGEAYEMPRMGLAIHAPFEVLPPEQANKAELVLSSNETNLPYYPFPFRFKVTYYLEKQSLINQFEIENMGSDTLYFALGGHPGFRFPHGPGYTRADYQYTFSEKMEVSRIEIFESLVQHKRIPFLANEDRLGLEDLRIPENGSGMFLKGVKARKIGLGLEGEAPFVTVNLEDFPNVNLWSPPGSPYACIEPMLSHHDLVDAPLAIEDKDHLITLAPGASEKYRYSISIHKRIAN